MLDPRLSFLGTILKEFAKDPVATATKLAPKCACGAPTIAACSECATAVCITSCSYISLGARDIVCVRCVEKWRA